MKTAGAAFLLALTLAGCGSTSEPSNEATATASATEPTPSATTEAPKGVTVEIEFVNGEVVPLDGKIDVNVGEPVTLHVISDVAEEIHVHSDPEHEYEVAAGDDKTFTFTIKTPGQVAVEAHELGVTIVELVARP
jgi:plastocyanin